MSIAASPSALQPEDYDEIEAAVMETSRGRWFLAEYARRARAAETEALRLALERIEARLDALGAPPSAEAVPIVDRLENLVWTLRESGVDDFVCGKIESLAREITAGGLVSHAAAIAQPEQPRDASSDGAAPDEPAAAPCLPTGESPCGAEEVVLHSSEVESHSPDACGEAVPAPDLPPLVDPRLDALLWLDRLPLLDRMAIFA